MSIVFLCVVCGLSADSSDDRRIPKGVSFAQTSLLDRMVNGKFIEKGDFEKKYVGKKEMARDYIPKSTALNNVALMSKERNVADKKLQGQIQSDNQGLADRNEKILGEIPKIQQNLDIDSQLLKRNNDSQQTGYKSITKNMADSEKRLSKLSDSVLKSDTDYTNKLYENENSFANQIQAYREKTTVDMQSGDQKVLKDSQKRHADMKSKIDDMVTKNTDQQTADEENTSSQFQSVDDKLSKANQATSSRIQNIQSEDDSLLSNVQTTMDEAKGTISNLQKSFDETKKKNENNFADAAKKEQSFLSDSQSSLKTTQENAQSKLQATIDSSNSKATQFKQDLDSSLQSLLSDFSNNQTQIAQEISKTAQSENQKLVEAVTVFVKEINDKSNSDNSLVQAQTNVLNTFRSNAVNTLDDMSAASTNLQNSLSATKKASDAELASLLENLKKSMSKSTEQMNTDSASISKKLNDVIQSRFSQSLELAKWYQSEVQKQKTQLVTLQTQVDWQVQNVSKINTQVSLTVTAIKDSLKKLTNTIDESQTKLNNLLSTVEANMNAAAKEMEKSLQAQITKEFSKSTDKILSDINSTAATAAASLNNTLADAQIQIDKISRKATDASLEKVAAAESAALTSRETARELEDGAKKKVDDGRKFKKDADAEVNREQAKVDAATDDASNKVTAGMEAVGSSIANSRLDAEKSLEEQGSQAFANTQTKANELLEKGKAEGSEIDGLSQRNSAIADAQIKVIGDLKEGNAQLDAKAKVEQSKQDVRASEISADAANGLSATGAKISKISGELERLREMLRAGDSLTNGEIDAIEAKVVRVKSFLADLGVDLKDTSAKFLKEANSTTARTSAKFVQIAKVTENMKGDISTLLNDLSNAEKDAHILSGNVTSRIEKVSKWNGAKSRKIASIIDRNMGLLFAIASSMSSSEFAKVSAASAQVDANFTSQRSAIDAKGISEIGEMRRALGQQREASDFLSKIGSEYDGVKGEIDRVKSAFSKMKGETSKLIEKYKDKLDESAKAREGATDQIRGVVDDIVEKSKNSTKDLEEKVATAINGLAAKEIAIARNNSEEIETKKAEVQEKVNMLLSEYASTIDDVGKNATLIAEKKEKLLSNINEELAKLTISTRDVSAVIAAAEKELNDAEVLAKEKIRALIEKSSSLSQQMAKMVNIGVSLVTSLAQDISNELDGSAKNGNDRSKLIGQIVTKISSYVVSKANWLLKWISSNDLSHVAEETAANAKRKILSEKIGTILSTIEGASTSYESIAKDLGVNLAKDKELVIRREAEESSKVLKTLSSATKKAEDDIAESEADAQDKMSSIKVDRDEKFKKVEAELSLSIEEFKQKIDQLAADSWKIGEEIGNLSFDESFIRKKLSLLSAMIEG